MPMHYVRNGSVISKKWCATCQCCSTNAAKGDHIWQGLNLLLWFFSNSLGCICCTWQELACPVGGSVSLPHTETATTMKKECRGRSLLTAFKKNVQSCMWRSVCVCVSFVSAVLWSLLGFCSSFLICLALMVSNCVCVMLHYSMVCVCVCVRACVCCVRARQFI